jgi:hypothetical protein
MAVLRFLSLLGWLAVFAVLLLFAIKNTEPATLLATSRLRRSAAAAPR